MNNDFLKLFDQVMNTIEESDNMSDKKIKTCSTCKHCKPVNKIFTFRWFKKPKVTYNYKNARCTSPHIGCDLVSGESKDAYCKIEREFDHCCGPDAKYHEYKDIKDEFIDKL